MNINKILLSIIGLNMFAMKNGDVNENSSNANGATLSDMSTPTVGHTVNATDTDNTFNDSIRHALDEFRTDILAGLMLRRSNATSDTSTQTANSMGITASDASTQTDHALDPVLIAQIFNEYERWLSERFISNSRNNIDNFNTQYENANKKLCAAVLATPTDYQKILSELNSLYGDYRLIYISILIIRLYYNDDTLCNVQDDVFINVFNRAYCVHDDEALMQQYRDNGLYQDLIRARDPLRVYNAIQALRAEKHTSVIADLATKQWCDRFTFALRDWVQYGRACVRI